MPTPLNDPSLVTPETISTVARHWLATQDVQPLAALLVAHGKLLLETADDALLQESLAALPVAWRDEWPPLLLLQAQLHLQQGDRQAAIQSYERASQGYREEGNLPAYIQCVLQLARTYHNLEDLEAARFYTDHAHTLLQDGQRIEPRILAELHLAMARLAPDIGRLGYSADHAEEALHLYEGIGDLANQLEAILLLAGAANQTGFPQRALSFVRIARVRNQVRHHENSHLWELALRNQEAHCLWYLGRLTEAAQVAQAAVQLADTIPHTKQRLYLRLLLGNIDRALGDYEEAHRCYDEAEALLEPLRYGLYQIWIQAQRAWLAVLQQEYLTARQRLRQVLTNCDQGQAMSFNLFLAAVYSLERQWSAAEQLLHQSQKFYERSGDTLSLCAIDCHLAYVALQRQQVDVAQRHADAMLTWLAEHNLCYFPHWWHDRIVGHVLVFALQHALCPATVEQILLGPLRAVIDAIIRPLLDQTPTPCPIESPELRALLYPAAQVDLTFVDNPQAHAVLTTLLQQGWLRTERFTALKSVLVSGKQRGQANGTLIAVFGLYLQGYTRREMAQRLAIAEATVRNYVTLIYEIFPLPEGEHPHAQQRFAALRTLAREAGYIGPSAT